ncbi:phasin family protein [Hahella ganghwensis]|uniref:phasin family protein n=1 Tax=Hahella ganghwensis TaxID=286420 RepID=UPI000381AD18|nr:phasin family protein [Hahella ganghwensis]
MENAHFDTMTEQMKKMTEPATRLNAVLFDHMGKLAEFHLKTVRAYGDLALENVKGAASVKDMESLKAYAGGQTEYLGQLGSRMIKDFRTLGELGVELKDDVEKALAGQKPEKKSPEE